MIKRMLLLAAAVGVAVTIVRRAGGPLGRSLRSARDEVSRRARYQRGRLQGASYRLAGRHPDEDVHDLVLADRVRSALGPLERRLDIPHVHVMVNDHIAVLHGDVASDDDRDAIETAVAAVSGVTGVESYLHIGLLPSDTRPSEGRAQAHAPSEARRRLEAAAGDGGADTSPARAVRAVLSSFCERIPPSERDHVLAHLPEDVKGLAAPPRRHPAEPGGVRTADQLVGVVAATDPELGLDQARAVTEGVLGELWLLVPEERTDVAAVLPHDLRDLWNRAGSAAEGEAR